MFITKTVSTSQLSDMVTVELHNTNEFGEYWCDDKIANVQTFHVPDTSSFKELLDDLVHRYSVGYVQHEPLVKWGGYHAKIVEFVELLALQLSASFRETSCLAELTEFRWGSGLSIQWSRRATEAEMRQVRKLITDLIEDPELGFTFLNFLGVMQPVEDIKCRKDPGIMETFYVDWVWDRDYEAMGRTPDGHPLLVTRLTEELREFPSVRLPSDPFFW